jgi:hypothetical protein
MSLSHLKNHRIWLYCGLLAVSICSSLFANEQDREKILDFERIEPKAQVIKQAEELFCYFLQPKGWDIVDSSTLPPHVQIAFIHKKSASFSPSFNLATEKVDVSQAEYLKIIKNIHESDRNNRWRHLGKVHTSAGLADLTEIDTDSEWGPIRILQLIFIRNGTAYVLTAAASKKEIASFYKDFHTSFRSLQITEDLIESIPQKDRREQLKQAKQHLLVAWERFQDQSSFSDHTFQKEHWIPFQNEVINNYEDMGAYWQVSLLRSIQKKILLTDSAKQETPNADGCLSLDRKLSQKDFLQKFILTRQNIFI